MKFRWEYWYVIVLCTYLNLIVGIWYRCYMITKLLSFQWNNNNQHSLYIIVIRYLPRITTRQGFLFHALAWMCTCVTLYCEFSNVVLGHATRMLPGMNEKTQSYIFTSRPGSLCPLQVNMEIGVLFSYCHERPLDWTIVCKVLHVPFEWGIYRYIDMYYGQKFLFDQQTLLKSSWCFKKGILSLKIVYGLGGVYGSKHVQNNVVISTIKFTLNK